MYSRSIAEYSQKRSGPQSERGLRACRNELQFFNNLPNCLARRKVGRHGKVLDPVQYLILIKPAFLDILPNLGESPPFPVEVFLRQEYECAEFLRLFPPFLPRSPVLRAIRLKMGYDG